MNYELLLREHNLKVTPQRIAILSLMQEIGHVDVEELYSSIKKEFLSISLATMYKNINSMIKTKLIEEIKIPGQKPKYEITKAPHVHLLCTECKEFVDLELNVEGLLSAASDKSSYKLYESNIILSGVCEKCQKIK